MNRMWIGLVHVRPTSGGSVLSPGAIGAYVNAVGFVRGRRHFIEIVSRELQRMRLRPVEFEEVEPLDVRTQNWRVPKKTLDLAEGISSVGEVRFDVFRNYFSDDEEEQG